MPPIRALTSMEHTAPQTKQPPAATPQAAPTQPPAIAAIQRMQQTAGNQAVVQLLKQTQAPAAGVIQRDPLNLPPVPHYQLTPPSLLQPRDPMERYHLGGDYHLRLDPDLQLQMAQMQIRQALDPASVLPLLSSIRLGTPPATGTTIPMTPPATTPPLVPRGEGPATPHAGSAGDVMDTILAIPSVSQAVNRLRDDATLRLRLDWGRLNTGERIGAVSTVAVIGLGALGAGLANPSSRTWLLGQINGKVLPVPGVDWLHVETNLDRNNLRFGLHVDVGQLLPRSWGFGPGSPNALGNVPQGGDPRDQSR